MEASIRSRNPAIPINKPSKMEEASPALSRAVVGLDLAEVTQMQNAINDIARPGVSKKEIIAEGFIFLGFARSSF